jgi:putative transposase
VSPCHIHMLVSAPPQQAPAKLVQFIKGRSSRRLQEEFPELQSGTVDSTLGGRYFCATVGVVDEQTIKQYIESRQWDEDDQAFKIVAPTQP